MTNPLETHTEACELMNQMERNRRAKKKEVQERLEYAEKQVEKFQTCADIINAELVDAEAYRDMALKDLEDLNEHPY